MRAFVRSFAKSIDIKGIAEMPFSWNLMLGCFTLMQNVAFLLCMCERCISKWAEREKRKQQQQPFYIYTCKCFIKTVLFSRFFLRSMKAQHWKINGMAWRRIPKIAFEHIFPPFKWYNIVNFQYFYMLKWTLVRCKF